jgi:GH15 family glucan-1,4-alpha-glucosidase
MSWELLDRARQLADTGHIPVWHADLWRREASAIRAFVEDRCWSEALGSYVRFAGGQELDAALLLAVLLGYGRPDDGRLAAAVDAIRLTPEQLGRGVVANSASSSKST